KSREELQERTTLIRHAGPKWRDRLKIGCVRLLRWRALTQKAIKHGPWIVCRLDRTATEEFEDQRHAQSHAEGLKGCSRSGKGSALFPCLSNSSVEPLLPPFPRSLGNAMFTNFSDHVETLDQGR